MRNYLTLCWQLFNFLPRTIYYLLGYFLSSLNKSDQERLLIRSQWFYRYLLRMGPLYIKIGQILATRSDLIDETLSKQLRNLQDNAPPTSERHIKEILEKELGQPIEVIFEAFCFEPVASASIAQVHKATLKTGQQVAVKVIKKDVPEQLRQNLKIAELLVKFVDFFVPSARQLNLLERFKEIYNLLIAQINLKQEADYQLAVYANFKNHPYVRVPVLVPELCTYSVIVMEFIEGIKGKNAHQVDLGAPQLARRLQETVWTMLYFHGLCHGDPHPGNIFFTKDGQVILLDFGITVQLSEDEKWGLSSFYFACTRKEWDLAVKRFTEHFVIKKNQIFREWNTYQQEIVAVLKFHFDTSKNKWSTISYFQDINKVLRKYDAQYTTSFTKVELLILSCEGFLLQIDPSMDIWANARKFSDRFSPYMNSTVKDNFDRFFGQEIPNSLNLRERAKNSLVAPTHLDRYFFPSTYPLFIKKALGSKIEDVDGNVYIDLSCGYGPHILGYAHPAITKALTQAVEMGGVNVVGNLPEVELAEAIVNALPGSEKAIFSNSGTEAVLQAIRLCRAYRQRNKIAKFEGHYHGFSDQGIVSSWFRFTGSKYNPEPIDGTQGCHKGIVKDTLVLQYGYTGSLDRLYQEREQIACVICEPMPSLMAAWNEEFLTKLRHLCTELDIPLIFDEVVTGFRVAYGGVQNLVNIAPDLICLGKIIGGGLPCGCVAGKQKLIDIAKSSQDPFIDYESKVFVGGTMSGNSLTCTAGLAALTYLKEHPETYSVLQQQTKWLAEEFIKIAREHKIPFKIKANHSIFSMSFNYRSTEFYREKIAGSNFKANLALAYYMRKHNVYIPELHTLMLNASHTQEDLNKICIAFKHSLEEMIIDGFFVV